MVDKRRTSNPPAAQRLTDPQASRRTLDLAGVGTDGAGAEPLTQALLPLSVDELRKKLEALSQDGSKEEKIFALNLDYMAKNLEAAEAERILSTP